MLMDTNAEKAFQKRIQVKSTTTQIRKYFWMYECHIQVV